MMSSIPFEWVWRDFSVFTKLRVFGGPSGATQAGQIASLQLHTSGCVVPRYCTQLASRSCSLFIPSSLQHVPPESPGIPLFAQSITSVSDIVPLGSHHGTTITRTRCRLSCWPCLWINAWRANHSPGCDFGKGDPILCVAWHCYV